MVGGRMVVPAPGAAGRAVEALAERGAAGRGQEPPAAARFRDDEVDEVGEGAWGGGSVSQAASRANLEAGSAATATASSSSAITWVLPTSAAIRLS